MLTLVALKKKKGGRPKKDLVVVKGKNDEDGHAKNWSDSEVHTLITLHEEMEVEFMRNVKKQGTSPKPNYEFYKMRVQRIFFKNIFQIWDLADFVFGIWNLANLACDNANCTSFLVKPHSCMC